MFRGALLAVFAWTTLASALSVATTNGASLSEIPWRAPLARIAAARAAVRGAHDRPAALPEHETHPRAAVWGPVFPSTAVHGHTSVPVVFELTKYHVFAATVAFGTPPQPVSLVLDLIVAETLVLNHKLDGHAFYDHTTSSTYQRNGTRVRIAEGTSYEIDGFVSRDHVTLGGATVRDQLFVELDSPDDMLEQLPPHFDGQIGFGVGRSYPTGAPSLVRAMISQGLLDRPEVGMHANEREIALLFGGVDAGYETSDFHYYNADEGAWMAPVAGVSVNGKQVAGDAGPCFVMDNLMIAGPAEAVDALAEAAGAENYALSCDGPGPDIVFQLADGFNVTMTKNEYAVEVQDGVCQFMFMPLDGATHWFLGLPFLRSVYTVLDFGAADGHERLGLATRKHTKY